MNVHVGGAGKALDFAVGDRVVCNNNDFAKYELEVGKEYVVTGHHYGDLRLDGVQSSWSASRFSLAAAAPGRKFQKGDRVRAKASREGLVADRYYTVSGLARTTGYDPDWIYWVNLDGVTSTMSSDGSFRESSFEHAPAIARPFAIGEYIEGTTGKGNTAKGPIVEFDASDKVMTYRIDAGDSKPWLITSTVKAATPPARAGGVFKVGDTLRVIDNKTGSGFAIASYAIGYVGKVTQVGDYNGPWVILDNKGQYLRPHQVERVALKVEAGKTYVTASGKRIGPMRVFFVDGFIHKGGDGNIWNVDGTARKYNDIKEDLVALAADTAHAAPAAQEPKFKVGDRVKTNAGYSFDPNEGVVTENNVGGDSDLYEVAGLVHEHTSPTRAWSYRTGGLSPATPTTPAIVALIENGQPKPATRPFVHPTREAAEKEAKRLAGAHKGSEFGVYEMVSIVKEEAPVYEHEWQRLAAAGQKINAIRELRAATGLYLRGAKDAVEDWLARQ